MLVEVIKFNAALLLAHLDSMRTPGLVMTHLPKMDLEPAPRDEQLVSDAYTFERVGDEDDGDPG